MELPLSSSSRIQGRATGMHAGAESSRVAVFLAVVVLIVSCLDLAGWWMHIPVLTSAIPHYATMKPNTALCLLLLAVAAWMRAGGVTSVQGWPGWAGDATAGFALLVSGLSLAEFATHLSFGLDQVLFSVPLERFGDPPGRMSMGTGVCLVLTSTALLLLDRLPRLSTALVLAGSLLSVSGLVGFVFQAGPLTGVPWLRSLAVHTGISLLLLQVSALALRPDREPFCSLTQQWRLKHRRRSLLPAVTLLPVLVALPILWGLRAQHYDAPFAMSVLVVLLGGMQTAVLWSDNRSIGRVESQLRDSERRASRILHSIGDAVMVTDLEGRVTRMNAVAETLTGWTAAEAEGRMLSAVFRIADEQTRQSVENPVDKVRRLGTIVGLANHTILLRRDGSEAHIDDSSAPIFDEAGELTGIVLVFRNVDERKAAERALRTGEERLRIALETAQLGSWELDVATGRLDCSDTCKANFGRKPEEAFDYADLLAAIHPEDLPGRQLSIRQAIETGEDYRAEYRVIWPDGSEHWVIASGRTIADVTGESVTMVGVTMDVTERHQAAQALIQNEKLAAVGRLAASIAHEINNPLESITNLLYLARGSRELPEIQEYLNTTEVELRRVSAITNQTLRFHKQASSPLYATFEELIGGVLSMYQSKLQNSHVEVRKRARAQRPVLCLDGEIRQVLSNLVGNAVDILHPGGGILQIRSREGTNWKTGQNGMVITVADTGGGMSARTLSKIFEPFFTTKGLAGTGLGLWISHEIVVRHHGSLRVRSTQRPGKSGTVFALFLPFAATDDARTNDGAHEPAQYSDGRMSASR